MDRREFSLSVIAAAVAGLAGCGGGDGWTEKPTTPATPNDPSTPGRPELATPTALTVATTFPQTIDVNDGSSLAIAPGQANHWDLDINFAVADGSDDQFDGALQLFVSDDVGGFTEFPRNQTYAELTAFGPELTETDGVKCVSFTNDPQFSDTGSTVAALHPMPQVSLQQTLDLSAAAGHPVSARWDGIDRAYNMRYSDEPFYFQVVVRDQAGTLLATLYRRDQDGRSGTGYWGAGSLTAFAGQIVVLSFEQCSTWENASVIDNVSVRDGQTNAEFVTNGNFEQGGAGWTVPPLRVAQNVRSGVRTVNGLQVQRSFYTQPNQRWGRMTDEFVNPGSAAVTRTIEYSVEVGADAGGVIYPEPSATARALTCWDCRGYDRDVGVAFGIADQVTYRSTSSKTAFDGDGKISVRFNITVPAGGRVTLVNFLVMTGSATGRTATDTSAKAAEVDSELADIANNFRTQVAFQRGLTQAQLDSLKNF